MDFKSLFLKEALYKKIREQGKSVIKQVTSQLTDEFVKLLKIAKVRVNSSYLALPQIVKLCVWDFPLVKCIVVMGLLFESGIRNKKFQKLKFKPKPVYKLSLWVPENVLPTGNLIRQRLVIVKKHIV